MEMGAFTYNSSLDECFAINVRLRTSSKVTVGNARYSSDVIAGRKIKEFHCPKSNQELHSQEQSSKLKFFHSFGFDICSLLSFLKRLYLDLK